MIVFGMLQYFLSLIVFVTNWRYFRTQHALEGSDMLNKAGLVTNAMIVSLAELLTYSIVDI